MRSTLVAMLLAVLLPDTPEAFYRGTNGEYDTAVCRSPRQTETHFWQKKSWNVDKPVQMYSKWRHIPSYEDFTLVILDSDVDQCGSEMVLNELRKRSDKSDGDEGTTFSSNKRGRAQLKGKMNDISLRGEDSIIGKWLQLTDMSGNMVGCCEIEEASDNDSVDETIKKFE